MRPGGTRFDAENASVKLAVEAAANEVLDLGTRLRAIQWRQAVGAAVIPRAGDGVGEAPAVRAAPRDHGTADSSRAVATGAGFAWPSGIGGP